MKISLVCGNVMDGNPGRESGWVLGILKWMLAMNMVMGIGLGETGGSKPGDLWRVENEMERLSLPEYEITPGAKMEELTPAMAVIGKKPGITWHRSHGGNDNLRYSATQQITPGNVHELQVAWTYHSGDGKGNIQCNPVIAEGMMFAPTVGNAVVAVDAKTGAEIWRIQPEGRPAHRGLTYLEAGKGYPSRILFSSGEYLYCVSALDGKPVKNFGSKGRAKAVQSVVAPAVWNDLILTAGFTGNAYAYSLYNGKLKWVFETIPGGVNGPADDNWGEFRVGANCWGGTALDDSRGIFFIATGSPKDNFIGVDHHGPNLYANCIVALNARTGERIWHFQEISHDIWDLDIPAPPNLTTITRHGIRVDVVTAVTKIGNTLLLDRVSGKPVFEFRRRRAPVSHLNGERTWPWQPDVELPQPFARQVFSLEDVTDISAEARESVMAKLIPGTSSRGANMGWFQPFEVGKSTAFYGIHGGAEWTGACIDPETGYLYVTSNELPWITMLHYLEQDEEEEGSAPKSPGRLVYEANCLACHGARRQGLATAPPLLAVKYGSDKPTIMKLLETGRNLMPAFNHLSADQKSQVTDYLLGIEDHAKTEQKSQESIFDKPPKYTFSGYIKLLDNEGHPGCKPPWGTLNCIDLNTGQLRWKVPLGEYAELTKRGIPKTGTENFGGASVTAGGLVFAGGTRDHKIRAFNKWTGEELWSAELPYGGYAPPTIYQVNGREHVVIPATGGGKLGGAPGDAFVAFALP